MDVGASGADSGGHFKDGVSRTSPDAEILPRAYVRCRQYPNPPRFDGHGEMARRTARWRYRGARGLASRSLMPDKVADLLLELAS